MKTFAIGDIHGQIKALERLIANLPISWGKDEVVFMGDLIDRGRYPKLVLEFVMALQKKYPNTVVLLGNHEQMLIDSYTSKNNFDTWINFGGKTTYEDFCPPTLTPRWNTFLSNFPNNFFEYMKSLPINYQNMHGIFVHAGAKEISKGEWNIDIKEIALWYREKQFWSNYDGKTIIVGHTPTNKIRKLFDEPLQPSCEMEAWHKNNIIAIDCGAGHNGRLCAVELPSRIFYYQSL